MKKLVLKKDVVARINNGEMNQLKGGVDTYNVCQTIPGVQATCGGNTCAPNLGCGGGGGSADCGVTQDICGMSHMQSMCDTCYIRCTII